MALINCDFFSDSLGLCCSMTVILPQNTQKQIGMKGVVRQKKHPVLYLLHGMSDDHTIWLRRTSIERYVSELGLAVVMPGVNRSYYTDMACGPKYWTFISEELPEIVNSFFPISEKREDTFAAGLSMGGYGAFKLALRQPERFAAAASLSGALDAAYLYENWPERGQEMNVIFGKKISGTDNDLVAVSAKLAKSKEPKPMLFQCCGTEDFLYKDNLRFRDHINSLGAFKLKYEEGPGTHEWGYWDTNIQKVLKWLPLKK
ncbi:MAG TPA: esterase [Lentisphaeria bacterium]|nr:MAG: esterase [Lentisphaerae bacterium GWF2_50_93]HCE45827.1 esterase [Lentisphaeria bacterium]